MSFGERVMSVHAWQSHLGPGVGVFQADQHGCLLTMQDIHNPHKVHGAATVCTCRFETLDCKRSWAS